MSCPPTHPPAVSPLGTLTAHSVGLFSAPMDRQPEMMNCARRDGDNQLPPRSPRAPQDPTHINNLPTAFGGTVTPTLCIVSPGVLRLLD